MFTILLLDKQGEVWYNIGVRKRGKYYERLVNSHYRTFIVGRSGFWYGGASRSRRRTQTQWGDIVKLVVAKSCPLGINIILIIIAARVKNIINNFPKVLDKSVSL